MTRRPSGRAVLVGGVVAVVAVVLGVAIAVLDPPGEERRRRLDERRVRDLREIAGAVDAYWTREGALPPDLETLAGWQGLEAPRVDPVTEDPYRYRVTGEGTYELCATFATEVPGRPARGSWRYRTTFWHHPAGEHCFELKAEELER